MQEIPFRGQCILLFSEEKDKMVVVYLDDITVFSKKEEDHLKHLEKVLLKCRRFGISLNPTKSIFSLTSENYLVISFMKDRKSVV